MNTKLRTKKDLSQALRAYKTVATLSESELETLEILANEENRNLIEKGIKESKHNMVHPIRSIL